MRKRGKRPGPTYRRGFMTILWRASSRTTTNLSPISRSTIYNRANHSFLFFCCCCSFYFWAGLSLFLAGWRRKSAIELRTSDGPIWECGRHLSFQQPVPNAVAVVRPGSCRGGSLFRPQQFRFHHLHGLLHQLSQVGREPHRSTWMSFPSRV